ncbi:MAG: hypothetical protein LBQ62_10010 [Candidatus Accumulibacter sp.]|jgi:hypothetical protein|nr:hypothetical protein [Accumulibacter sp.]
MVGKHYGWHKRWQLSADGKTATHECGFAAWLLDRADDGATDGTVFLAAVDLPDGKRRVVTTRARVTDAIAALTPKHGGGNAPLMVERLGREAPRIFEFAAMKSASQKTRRAPV